MFACERHDSRPDMLLVAKGTSSGYPPLAER
jgi:adenosylmethionine-8-amino-7-oxononanoate aminotransferase